MDAASGADRALVEQLDDLLGDVFTSCHGVDGRRETQLIVLGEALGIRRDALEEVERDGRALGDASTIHVRLVKNRHFLVWTTNVD